MAGEDENGAKYNSRKYIIANKALIYGAVGAPLSIAIGAAALVAADATVAELLKFAGMTAKGWLAYFSLVWGVYGVGNVGEHFATALKK